ncbi:MAG: RDD family protein [Flavobacterium sp.]|uniref:RDD family protein n=1 Tax=Flavobacterium sp. TaxID=239 RepID=UPI002FCAEB5E
MSKLKLLSIRLTAALIDILIFAIILKVLEPFIYYKEVDGNRYTHSVIVFLLYYIVFLSQDIFMNKTVGKYIFKLEMTSDITSEKNSYKKYYKIIIRRAFDLLEIVCPFLFIIPFLLTKKNQKIGDLISKTIVRPKLV